MTVRNANTLEITAKGRTFEWPTWLLIITVYSVWLLTLLNFSTLGAMPASVILIVVGTLHTSVQHELLHGHPTRSVFVNGVLAYPPLTLLFPYPIYRSSHIHHHNNEHVTIPGIDPESFYISRRQWENSCAFMRAYCTFRMTLLGRLLTGPAHSGYLLLRKMLNDFAACRYRQIIVWLTHIALVSALLWAIHSLTTMPVWLYFLVAYMANALMLLRSFFEHRAVEDPQQRSIIMECCPFFRLLFLNNNFHFVHHEHPNTPWYKLPATYRSTQDKVLNRNGQFICSGYRHWVTQHLLTPVDSPVHPFAND